MTRGFIIIFLVLSACNNVKPQNKPGMIDNSTVKTLELDRYFGTWYEIARYPHRFEKDLVGVTATYSKKDNGKIKVVNKGYYKSLNGKEKVAVGKAKIPNVNDPGKLKVSFFLFFYSDYFIMELDKDYQWVLIGSSSPEYLWILSRTPVLEEAVYQKIVDKAVKRGYTTDKLIRVQQKG